MGQLTPGLTLLKERVFAFKDRRVAYLEPNSRDKETRRWATLPSKRFNGKYYAKDTMFKEDLHKWEQLQINDAEHLNAITFDVDEPSLFQYPDDCMPYCKTKNVDNSKYHLTYMLKEPFYAKSDKQKRKLENEIKPQIKMLDIAIGADANYANTTIKNPFNDYLFETTTSEATVDIWHFLNSNQPIITNVHTALKDHDHDNKYLSPKHRAALEPLIAYSRANIHLLFKDSSGDLYRAAMKTFADKVRNDFYVSDFDSLVSKVITKAEHLAKDFSNKQSMRVKRRWNDQVKQNQSNIYEACLILVSKGMKITAKNVAMMTDLSLQTIKNNKHYSTIIKTMKEQAHD